MKILTLCNLYGAEVTFIKEMQVNPNYTIVPVVDPNDPTVNANVIYKHIVQSTGVNMIAAEQGKVDNLIKQEAPDITIVRCWTGFAKLQVPGSLFWKIESTRRKVRGAELTVTVPNKSASYFCTQNKLEVPLYASKLNIPVAYFPRGVCPTWEFPCKKTVDVVSTGTAVSEPKVASFNMLVKPLSTCLSPEQLHVYISWGATNLEWLGSYAKTLHMIEDAPAIVGSAKIFVSPVTTRFDPGIFSQKSLQAMACRTLVLTQHYTGVEDIVGPDGENLIYADSPEEAVDKVKYYLSHDNEREAIAERGYKFVHAEYNYTKVFERALKELGIV